MLAPTTEGGTLSEHPTTNGGRLLKRGDSFDIECHRTTHRLQVAQGILRNLGFTPTWPEHGETCMLHPKNAWNRCFGFNYTCLGDCPRRLNPPPIWPEGVSGEIFDTAYRLADAVQDRRGQLTAEALNRYDREKREARRAAATS